MSAKLPPMYMDRPCHRCGGTGTLRRLNGAWMRFVRLQAGVALREMARRIGVSAPYVCDVEHDNRTAPRSWQKHYAKTWRAKP